MWAFVPALRRVRAVSPANRSDGYLGSDISGDDGFFFDGKPEDFDVEADRQARRAAGRRSQQREGQPQDRRPRPGGGFEVLDLGQPAHGRVRGPELDRPLVGADQRRPGPAAGVGRRGDAARTSYYLYGKIELWIDAETWDGSWNIKFSWQGDVVHSYQTMARVNQQAENDARSCPASTQVWACAENFKMNRATLGGMRADPKAPFVRRIQIDSNIFDSQALSRYGK